MNIQQRTVKTYTDKPFAVEYKSKLGPWILSQERRTASAAQRDAESLARRTHLPVRVVERVLARSAADVTTFQPGDLVNHTHFGAMRLGPNLSHGHA